MPYTRKSEVFEAVIWTKPSDQPGTAIISIDTTKGKSLCTRCGKPLSEHWTYAGKMPQDAICPGMVILKGDQGTLLKLTDAEFKAQFEEVPTS